MTLKIVMYHYVRPIKESKHKNIKGLELENFINQIDYLKNNYKFITAQQLVKAIYNNCAIPENSILLTFDDGLKDHYRYVFPILKKHGVQGLFFPPGQAIEENKVLDVQKIQFILSECYDTKGIIEDIRNFIHENKKQFNLDNFETYFSRFSEDSRFDTKEVVFIKRMLQKMLPRKARNIITDMIFKKYVTSNEESFARDLYLSEEEIDEMNRNGMYFGSHGYSHEWFSNLTESELDFEIEQSVKFYKKINHEPEVSIIAYPYGDYTPLTITKLQKMGFKIGMTAKVGNAEFDEPFLLQRFDTNDFPKHKTS